MALLAQLTGVAVGVFQRDGAVGQEAVAVSDAIGRQTQYRAGQHGIAVQHHQPVGRTHEADGGEPVGQLIGHELGNGQLRQGLDDDLADDVSQHGARLGAGPVEDVLLAVVATGKRRDLGTLAHLISAMVGWPSAFSPTATDGPLIRISRASAWARTPGRRTASRRGVA